MNRRDSLFPLIVLGLLAQIATVTATASPMPAGPVAALIAKARTAQDKGNTDLAERLAQSAIVADPASTAGYVALADIYAAAHEPDFARNYYDEALSIDPSDKAALKAMAALDRSSAKADAQGP